MSITPKTILTLVAASTALAASSWVFARTAYDAAQPDGYFWYKDKPKAKPKAEPAKEPAPVAPAPAPSAEAKPKPGSAEWFRRTEQQLLDKMTGEPDEKTVFAYQTLNRLRMDRADEVARIWERNNIKYPFLSEEVRMPFSARARQQALWQIDQAKEAIMADISKKAGLWMFFDSKCNYCHSQFDTVSMLQQKYRGMESRFISTEGGVIKGMPADKIRFDHGALKARSLGIQITPAIVLVAPPEKMGIIAHGAMSLSDLEEKIVTASIDMKIADPKLAQTAKMNERGMINRSDWEAAGITGNESTEELADKIYKILGNKMEE